MSCRVPRRRVEQVQKQRLPCRLQMQAMRPLGVCLAVERSGALVAQPDRATGFYPVGCRFESCRGL